MGLLDNNDDLMALGMGLLSASGPKYGPPASFGQVLASGVGNMQESQRQRKADQMREEMYNFQKQQQLAAQEERMRKQQALTELRNQLPEQMRAVFDVDPGLVLGQMYKERKPMTVGKNDRLVDPSTNQVILDALPEEVKPTSDLQNYQQALKDGFKGTFFDYQTELKKAGRPVTSSVVNMPPMENEFQKGVGKQLAEAYTNIQNAGVKGVSTLSNLDRMDQLMAGVQTGKLAPLTKDIAALGASVGIKIDDKLPQKEALQALSNELALAAKTKGGENQMPGAMSDADRQFLMSMVPSLGNTPQGNQMIIETMRRLAKRDVEVSKMARDFRKKNGTLDGFSETLQDWSNQNPLFNDLQASTPQTGFKIIGVR